MGNFIELDINPVELELSQTEKLTKPIEAMSIDEYLECLSYTETDELPTQDEMSKEVVDKMNSTYSKVMVGGKFRIAEERGSNLIFHPKNELKDFNAHLICHYKQSDSRGAVTRKRINAIDAFMQSSKASRFSEVIFNPAKVGDYGVTKNLFNGFPKTPDTSKPIKLNQNFDEFLEQVSLNYPKCVRLIEHAYNNVCDENHLAFMQLMNWQSNLVTQPEVNEGFGVIFRGGERGSGKSTLAEILRLVVGDKYWYKATDINDITGRFNAHMGDKLLIVGEEMTWGGTNDVNQKMKDLMTSNAHSVEMKGIDKVMMPKYYRMMLVTNEDWVFKAAKDERRILVLDVANNGQAQDDKYFDPLYQSRKVFDAEMVDQFRDMLASLDVDGVDMSKPVETDGLKAQKIESMSPMEQWWYDCCYRGEIKQWGVNPHQPTEFPTVPLDGSERVAKISVHESYLSWWDDKKPKGGEKITSQRAFGKRFKNMTGDWWNGDQKTKDGRNAYEFLRPKEMIKHFTE